MVESKKVHPGKKRLHLNKKGKRTLAKNLLRYTDRKKKFLPIDVDSGNDCLSITLKRTSLDVCPNCENIRKNNSNKIVIAHLNINSTRNKFNSLADIVKIMSIF